jgi:hypothetical protein
MISLIPDFLVFVLFLFFSLFTLWSALLFPPYEVLKLLPVAPCQMIVLIIKNEKKVNILFLKTSVNT